jgi:hypothetical protein
MKKSFAVVVLLLSLIRIGSAQSGFYAMDTIQQIDIYFSQPNWDYMMDTAKAGAEGYILADSVVINGVMFDSAGVKYKGNSSYSVGNAKNPLHIELNYTHGNASYNGVQDIKLSNGYSDPSHVREVLAYSVLRNYMAAPECNFARVNINGDYYGLFSSAQDIDSDFNSDHFYSSTNSFFKCNPVSVVSGQIPNLLYLGTDSANYYSRYEMKSDAAWQDLISLCDTLNNSPLMIDSILDVDRALWMLAFNNVCINLDSYTGAFAQNYYLYKDDNGRFNPIVWDLNMCFGGFTNTGTSNLSVATMPSMSPILHYNYGARPLIMNLLSDSTYYRMYCAHMRTITAEFFANGAYITEAQQLQTLVDSSVAADSNSFYSYAQFQNSMNTAYGNVPGIQQLMDARVTYLNTTPQYTAGQPVITNVGANPAAIALYDTAWVTCTVTDENSVYLGYRDQIWKRFYRVQMYDDGLHHDGAANDSVYGAAMIGTSALMQYYIYAENSTAGMFSPVRAEYEFHSYLVSVNSATAGQVVLNELLSFNLGGCTDASGAHEDWIELFNTTGAPLNLQGLYLTDDPANHLKWALPSYIIPANGFAVVWADEDPGSSGELHANFKLSSGGEFVLLCNANGTVLDSIAFGILATDNSYGRCPNGYGSWINYSWGGCGGWNICPTDISENETKSGVAVYPNPATTVMNIVNFGEVPIQYELISATGQSCSTGTCTGSSTQLDISQLAAGMYILMVRDQQGNFLSSERIIKE